MSLRSLIPSLCLVPLLAAGPANAADINKCQMVAEGRAEIISFDAERADGSQVALKGLLTGPDGTGPFPAIVILPGSSTLITPYCYESVVAQFENWGFVTLILAPTTARDGNGKRLFEYSFADLGRYAYGAASALAALPRVEPTGMALWGHSRGGGAVIDAVSHAIGKPSPFRAAVAAAPWPGCPAKAVPPTNPLLILFGTHDTESSPDWCADYAARLADVGGFEFQLIPNAGHLYWVPQAPDYDATAASFAERRLKAFLAKHVPAASRVAD